MGLCAFRIDQRKIGSQNEYVSHTKNLAQFAHLTIAILEPCT